MKSWMFACLSLFALPPARAAAPDETALLRLTDEFDTAVAAENHARLVELLDQSYLYVEPARTYQAPVPRSDRRVPLEDRITRRLTRDKCRVDAPPDVQVVGDTAVVSGTYRVVERTFSPDDRPRFVAQGRFTATWVRSVGAWHLLAEHRSLNDVQAWPPVAADVPPPAGPGPAAAAAETSGLGEWWEKREQARQERETVRDHRGFLPKAFTNLFRSYEPTQIGYTWDEGDDGFMDFTFSTMLPLHPAAREYPDPVRHLTDQRFFRPATYSGLNVYFAATVRSGQYIGTRPSSPVVGKRFNPLVAFRLWAKDPAGQLESEDNFVELVYAHESNGQFIASKERFDEQLQVYHDQYKDAPDPAGAAIATGTAYRSARDNISRGWDYVGLQFARDWDARLWLPLDQKVHAVTMGLRAKYNYYLPWGLAQKQAEEYNAWENDPQGKRRNRVDGLSLNYTLSITPDGNPEEFTLRQRLFRFERRYALVWTTGAAQPFAFNTLEAQASVVLLNHFPLTLWSRWGYNSDLIDYYRRDHSIGLSLTYWKF